MIQAGCQKSPAPSFRANSVEILKQEGLQLADGEHFDANHKQQIGSLLTALFGTPDEPAFPYFLGDEEELNAVVSLENLKLAAGPVSSDRKGHPQGLYREHCAHCHGISGDGAGPTAAFLNPYPRDFRLGKFKFKSTRLGRPPTNHDLSEIIQNGIPGTAMPSFRTLDPKELASLIDYVKYLSIRGKYERRLIRAIGELDEGQSFYDLDLVQSKDHVDPDTKLEEFQDQVYFIISEYLIEESILERWYDVDDSVTAVPAAPANILATHPDHYELVSNGKLLFQGKANCVQCHGDTGMGDGQTENFDDWVTDWTKKSGGNVNPLIPESYQHFIQAGALKPRTIRPRNLRLPVFRGGGHPDDLYRRIANGIEGTPMPSSPALQPDDIWALVAYVKAMPYENTDPKSSKKKPVNDRPIQ